MVGDISGHGVDSALLMATARAFLRMRASQPGTLSEIITAMNRHLTRDVLESGMFMTLFYLTIDTHQRSLAWVRAGHDAAMVYDPALDRFKELMGQGVALGVDEALRLPPKIAGTVWPMDRLLPSEPMASGKRLIKKGEMFGKNRLRRIIRAQREGRCQRTS